jgi:hypothetical protein
MAGWGSISEIRTKACRQPERRAFRPCLDLAMNTVCPAPSNGQMLEKGQAPK